MVCFVYISDYSVVLSPFLMFHDSFFFNFFPFWRLSLSQFLRIYLEVTNYFFSFIWECLSFTLIFFFFFFGYVDLGCCAQAFSSSVSGAYSFCGAYSHCGGFSCFWAWALGPTGLIVVAHGLSCSPACGIFLDQGSNPCPLYWQADS